jgi:hypothetical protein
VYLETGGVRIIENAIVLGEHAEPMRYNLDKRQISAQIARGRDRFEDVGTTKTFTTETGAHELKKTFVKVAAVHLESPS